MRDAYTDIMHKHAVFKDGREQQLRPSKGMFAIYSNWPSNNKVLDRELQEIIRKRKDKK